jgi:hypothetical protein
MNAPNTMPLDILVRLTNGHTARFRQEDAEAARQLLNILKPDRLFAQRQLLIAGGDALTAFLCGVIEGIDLVTDDPPDWPFHRHMVGIWEITQEEFRRLSGVPDRPPIALDRGPVFLEIEMVSGRRVCLKLRLDLPTVRPLSLDIAVLMQQFFAGPSLHAVRHGGGVILLNPANIVRILARPVPPEMPPGVWPAEYVSVNPAESGLSLSAH